MRALRPALRTQPCRIQADPESSAFWNQYSVVAATDASKFGVLSVWVEKLRRENFA